jgi:hypothetical protein
MKRVLSVAVAVLLAAGLMPVAVFATEAAPQTSECTCEAACEEAAVNQECATCAADASACAGTTTTAQQGSEEPVASEPAASNSEVSKGSDTGNSATETPKATSTETADNGNISEESTESTSVKTSARESAAISTYSDDTATTKTITYLDEKDQPQEVTATAIPLSTSEQHFVFSEDGWYFVDATEATFSKNWQIDANVNIILLNNQKIYFSNKKNIDIYKERNGSITFYSQSREENEGYLQVISYDNPGIGNNKASGDITFNGGRFDLGDSSISPAIGGKYDDSNFPNITINAGTLNFIHKTDSYDAINAGTKGTVTITGGTLNFADRSTKSQINTGTLTITGGTVNCGNVESNVNITAAQSITISGGTVYATRGSESDGTTATAIYSGGSFSTGSSGTAHITTTKLEAANGTDTSTWSCIYTQVTKPDGVEILGTKVYGHQTLSGDITIAKNEIFTVPNGAKVTIPEDATLTNNGSLIIAGYAVAEKAASVRMSSTATLSGVIETYDNRIILIPQVAATSKTYDGNTQADFTIKFAGLPQSASELTMNQDYSAKAAFTDANAGENKEVSASIDLFANNNTSNYVLSSNVATTTAAINKAPISPSVTANDKTYDGSTKAEAKVSFKGLLTSDALEEGVDYVVSAEFDSANAGTSKYVTVTVTLEDTEKANNYVLNPSQDATTASIFRATHSTPSDDSHIYNLNFTRETIDFESMLYEINSSADFNGNVISEGSWITPGDILYIRAKEDMNHEASQALKITIPMRPAAPANVSTVAASDKSVNDGKITGLDNTMEYQTEDGGAWTAVTGDSIGGLAPGTYLVRYCASPDNFASETVSVKVGANSTITETKDDGTIVTTTYDEAGTVLKEVETDTAGTITTTIHNEDGTKTATTVDTEGNKVIAAINTDGTKVATLYDATGAITWERTYATDGSYVQAGFDPEIIEGANGVYTHEETIGFRSNDEFVNFLKVYVDDVELDSTQYTAESGSIKISLSKDYLESLAAGTHKLTIASTNGEPSTTFTVEEVKETTPTSGVKDPSESNDKKKSDEADKTTNDDKTTETDTDNKSTTDNKSSDNSKKSNDSKTSKSSSDSSSNTTILSATSDALPLALCLALLLVATGSLVVLICSKKKRLQ